MIDTPQDIILAAYQNSFVVGFMSLLLFPKLKAHSDYKRVVNPLRERMREDFVFKNCLDNVGKLDELLSFYKYSKAMPVITEKSILDNLS